jgi:hypothetical protein
MKAQSTTLAIAALTLWLVPSGGFAQGNSGKSRVTICHIPPGNPDAQSTLRVPEPALRGHESHGDVLGPCEGYGEGRRDEYDDSYGDEPRRAKKGKKKGRKEHGGGPDDDDTDDEFEAGDRADEAEETDEADSEYEESGPEETSRRAQRKMRREERRAGHIERREREQSDARAEGDSQTKESTASDDAGEAEADDAVTGTDDAQEAKARIEPKTRSGARSKRGTRPDAETDEPREEDQGFFRGMRRFFGFSEEEIEE